MKLRPSGYPQRASGEFREAIRVISAPSAPHGLIDRVVAERVRGARAAIPDGEPAVPRPAARPAVLAAAAAALVIASVGLQRWHPVDRDRDHLVDPGECAMIAERQALLAASVFFLAVACGQEPTGQPVGPTPPPASLNAGGPQEGTWTYDGETRDGRAARREVYRLTRVGSGGDVQWLGVASRGTAAGARTVVDSVYFAADGVRPLRRVYRAALTGRDLRVVTTTYRPDSASVRSDYLGYRSSPAASRTSSVAIPADLRPIIPPMHGPGWGFAHIVRFLPLEAEWSGSVYVAGFPTAGYLMESLQVTRGETIEVPAGTFDCWRIAVEHNGQQWLTLWVGKDSRQLVKAVLAPKGARGYETVLVSFEGP
jgi:hypothetical protein